MTHFGSFLSKGLVYPALIKADFGLANQRKSKEVMHPFARFCQFCQKLQKTEKNRQK